MQGGTSFHLRRWNEWNLGYVSAGLLWSGNMTISGWLICICSLTLIAWDMIAVMRYGIEASESWWIRKFARKYPLVMVAIGVLIGHFFAGMSE